ncbi:hypothetical protein GIB67_015826, partial [Kingdonia uniflora]
CPFSAEAEFTLSEGNCESVHRCDLFNFEKVQPYLEKHKSQLILQDCRLGKNDGLLNKKHSDEFSEWFKHENKEIADDATSVGKKDKIDEINSNNPDVGDHDHTEVLGPEYPGHMRAMIGLSPTLYKGVKYGGVIIQSLQEEVRILTNKAITVVSAMALNMGILASYDQSVELFKDQLGFGEASIVVGDSRISALPRSQSSNQQILSRCIDYWYTILMMQLRKDMEFLFSTMTVWEKMEKELLTEVEVEIFWRPVPGDAYPVPVLSMNEEDKAEETDAGDVIVESSARKEAVRLIAEEEIELENIRIAGGELI